MGAAERRKGGKNVQSRRGRLEPGLHFVIKGRKASTNMREVGRRILG